MGNYFDLIAAINAAIKTNGEQGITGASLNAILRDMVAALGAGYQYVGVVAPDAAAPSTDYNAVYLGLTAGTYTNFGGTQVRGGQFGVFTFNGSWTYNVADIASGGYVRYDVPQVMTQEQAAQARSNIAAASNDDVNAKYTKPALGIPATDLAQAVQTSLGKADAALPASSVVDNLTTEDATKALSGKQGKVLGDAVSQLGQEVNGIPSYDWNKSIAVTQGTGIPRQTKYDVVMRAGRTYTITKDSSVIGSGQFWFYASAQDTGTSVNFPEGTPKSVTFTPVTDIIQMGVFVQSSQALGTGTLNINIHWETETPGLVNEIKGKLDKIHSSNLYDATKGLHGAYLVPSTGATGTGGELYGVSDYIPVSEEGMVANCYDGAPSSIAPYVVYAADKSFRRAGTTQAYTYTDGDAFIRFTFYPWAKGQVNIGSTLLSYEPYSDYRPVMVLEEKVAKLESYGGSIETSVALFPTFGVAGDSYARGSIYDVPGTTDGPHEKMAWPNIMAKRNGNTASIYAKGGLNAKTWLTDENGLPALLADTAKNLYFIMIGINSDDTIGTIADCNADWTENADSFYGNYGKIIGNIKAHAPSAKIVCIVPNMMSDHGTNMINAGKQQAIRDVAEFYDVPFFDAIDDPYFSSSFYTSMLVSGHPVGVTYAGMALAFERLFAKCVAANSTYFQDVEIN